jgi:hypothetical protein
MGESASPETLAPRERVRRRPPPPAGREQRARFRYLLHAWHHGGNLTRAARDVGEALVRRLGTDGRHEINEQDGKGPILDLVIVAGMQRIEHYEIAAYGTDIALAKALGEQEVVDLLAQTLEEEKQADLKLTEVTEQQIMPDALAEQEENSGSSGRQKPTRGRSKAA